MQRRADDDSVAAYGNRMSEPIAFGGIVGGEFGFLQPRFPFAHKDISSAGESKSAMRMLGSPDDNRAPGDKDIFPERIRSAQILGEQFRLLFPSGAIADEDIGCPGVLAGVVALWRADNGSISVNGDGMPEIVCSGGIVGSEFCLLFPCAATRSENKSGASAVAAVAVVRGSHDGGVRGTPQMETSDGDSPSETSFGFTDLCLHFPPIVFRGVYLNVIFGVRSYDDCSRYDIDSELSVSGSSLGADQLDFLGVHDGLYPPCQRQGQEAQIV